VEILTSDEFRLAYAVLLQAAALAGAWRFVRRRVATDAFDRAADALLLNFLVQYLAVAISGLFGILGPLTIALFTLALSAALFFAPTKLRIDDLPRVTPARDHWVLLACTLFGVAYGACAAFEQRFAPVLAQDSLTYHYPAAVKWLQTGRLALFETWFFNPANTYSPLAGSTFIAWWIAPMGNDVLARHVPVPALILVFFAAVRLMRAVGARPAVAGVIALALVLSQPFIRQSIIEKDDLYLAAFFTCFVAGCAPDRLRDPLGPSRLGVALGLLLASKYTALLAAPALLLLIDAPIRAGWPLRRYATAFVIVLLIAGPWYLRNALLTGNPLYPVDVKLFGLTLFPGLFESARSEKLRSAREVLSLLTTRDQSLPAWPAVILVIALLAAFTRRFRQLRTDPLVRTCLLGPLLVLLPFWALAPYAEIRFIFPGFILLFAAGAIAVVAWARRPYVQVLAALAILIPAWATGFNLNSPFAQTVYEIIGGATLITCLGLLLAGSLDFFPAYRKPIAQVAAVTITLAASAYAYVNWSAFVRGEYYSCRTFWILPARQAAHGDLAVAWQWACDNLPPTEPLAYTNTFLVHPLTNFDHTRPVVYVPTRRGITHIHDLPHLPGGKLPGERLEQAFAAALAQDTDADGWLAKLAASRAKHLFIATPKSNPPELSIIQARPERFEKVFENPAAVVYRLK
jgi:hypothetical protein